MAGLGLLLLVIMGGFLVINLFSITMVPGSRDRLDEHARRREMKDEETLAQEQLRGLGQEKDEPPFR
jgi:hypothetical protein